MLLIALIIAGESVWGPRPLALVPAVMALGALAVGELWLRKRWLTRFLMWLTLEELLVQWTAVRYQPELLRQVVVLIIGLFILAGLISKISLPDKGLPVRGLWLRRLLAIAGLICLIPWPIEVAILNSAFARGELPWLQWLCAFLALCYFIRTTETLARS